MIKPRVLVLDFETSGLDPKRCAILQIGAVWLHEDLNQEGLQQDAMSIRANDRFFTQVRFNPYMQWDAEAQEVHGITKEQAMEQSRPSDYAAVNALAEWVRATQGLEDSIVLAGLNVYFDHAFLQATVERAAQSSPIDPALMQTLVKKIKHAHLDLHSLALAKVCTEGLELPAHGYLRTDDIYNVLGMDAEPKPHHALTGALMEAQALNQLIYGSSTLD